METLCNPNFFFGWFFFRWFYDLLLMQELVVIETPLHDSQHLFYIPYLTSIGSTLSIIMKKTSCPNVGNLVIYWNNFCYTKTWKPHNTTKPGSAIPLFFKLKWMFFSMESGVFEQTLKITTLARQWQKHFQQLYFDGRIWNKEVRRSHRSLFCDCQVRQS